MGPERVFRSVIPGFHASDRTGNSPSVAPAPYAAVREPLPRRRRGGEAGWTSSVRDVDGIAATHWNGHLMRILYCNYRTSSRNEDLDPVQCNRDAGSIPRARDREGRSRSGGGAG